MRSSLSAIVVASTCISGCATSSDPALPASNASLESGALDAEAAFQDALAELYSSASSGGNTGTHAPQAFTAPSSICTYLKPLVADPRFTHPYFFAGASLQAAAGVGEIGGVSAVYDLFNQQAAMFYFTGDILETAISVGATDRAGLAFGIKPNVIDAWSGHGNSVSVGIALPFLDWFGVGASYFASPDQSMVGVSGSLSLSAGLALPIDITLAANDWTPFDSGTEQLAAHVFGLPISSLEHATFAGTSYELIQFKPPFGSSNKTRAVSLGKGLVQRMGASAVTFSAAALALAIGVWRDANAEISEICP